MFGKLALINFWTNYKSLFLERKGMGKLLMQNTNNATDIWDERYAEGRLVCTQAAVKGDPIDYTQHPLLYRNSVSLPLTGNPDKWVMDDIGETYLTPAPERLLALGSGMAFIEETFVKKGFAKHIIAYEASKTAVEAGRKRIKEAGLSDCIDLRCGNALEENLPSGYFDVVFVQAAIHHFFEIEAMFQLMHRVLKPGGLLIYDEYIGPDHHMYDSHVMDVINEINACLAPEYQHDSLSNSRRMNLPPMSLEWMLNHDPSKGVHASDILPLTYQYFDVVRRRDYGGTIMRPFWVGILPNFNFDDPKDATVARLIVLLERLLTKHSIIPHYHTTVVARRKDVVRAALSPEECEGINYSNWNAPA